MVSSFAEILLEQALIREGTVFVWVSLSCFTHKEVLKCHPLCAFLQLGERLFSPCARSPYLVTLGEGPETMCRSVNKCSCFTPWIVFLNVATQHLL